MKYTPAIILAFAAASVAQSQDALFSILSVASSQLYSFESAYTTQIPEAESALSSASAQLASLTSEFSTNSAASSIYNSLTSELVPQFQSQQSELSDIYASVTETGTGAATTNAPSTNVGPSDTITTRSSSGRPSVTLGTGATTSPTSTSTSSPNVAPTNLPAQALGVAGAAVLGLAAFL